ncbi:MAG: glycosyltransferase family 9 protein [Gemmataceae bacterium]|nr:glycosyltransferase family 9 protein [Gemmataceae bacterium]
MLDFEPRRIVIIKPSALGDIVHSLPVLSALRRRFPQAHIAWAVNRVYRPLLENHPHLDALVPFDRGRARNGIVAGILGFTRYLRRLQHERFDLAVDLQGLLRTGVMSLATRARARIGLASAREGAAWLYTHRIDDRREQQHAVDRYWLVAEALGAASGEKEFILPIDRQARRWAQELLHGRPRPWLAVGVGARWITKRWPPGHFAALTQRALDNFGGTAIFVGAPDEAALAHEAAARLHGPVVNLAGATDLRQLVALLAQADVMIANDTGPLHVAVALGRPVVAPYTCTQVVRTGPYGQLGRGVETAVWCRGSYLKKCPRLECMPELTPDRLWLPLHDVLLTWQRQRQPA